jgi:uncharacterized protein YcfL
MRTIIGILAAAFLMVGCASQPEFPTKRHSYEQCMRFADQTPESQWFWDLQCGRLDH